MEEFLPIKSFRVKNFKGIRDSGDVRFTPLTVFIGNNGSGKSSLIEALQTYQDIVVNGLDKAMNRWRGFENIHNPPISLVGENEKKNESNFIEFNIIGEYGDFRLTYLIKSDIELTHNELRIAKEIFDFKDEKPFMYRDFDGNLQSYDEIIGKIQSNTYSIFHELFVVGFISNNKQLNKNPIETSRFVDAGDRIKNWQFTTLNPANMVHPLPLQRTGRLNPDGSNIAEYLMDIRKKSQDAYDGIIKSLTHVLPYLKDMKPNITTELERTVYLRMHESDFTVPQWLLSTGTMRILCLLALFRHPTPPPVIFIEEIENGLDPRTIHFIVEEIRSLIVLGKSQVVITTHSPYLLDLLDLSQIVVVERENGETTFHRPDEKALESWSKKFGPGKLYTMDRLAHQEG